jgi:hypothetical protein
MFDSSPIDQADEYGRNLLSRNQLSEVEKFNLLREISICVAGNRVDGKPRTFREEYESLMLGLYQEKTDLDLHTYRGSIGANFTADIMKKRILRVNENLRKTWNNPPATRSRLSGIYVYTLTLASG